MLPNAQWSNRLAAATHRLLLDVELLAETRRRAYEYATPMFWPNVGRRYLDFFGHVVGRKQNAAQPLPRYSQVKRTSRRDRA